MVIGIREALVAASSFTSEGKKSISPAGIWSVCPRIQWYYTGYTGYTGFCRATLSLSPWMDGHKTSWLANRYIWAFPIRKWGSQSVLVLHGVVNVGRRNLENTEYEQQHSRVKIMTPDQALYYWTPALNSPHQRLEVSWTRWPNFLKVFLDSLLLPKPPPSNVERCEKGAHRARMQGFLPILFATMVFVFLFWKQTWIKPIFPCFLRSRSVKFLLDLD